MDDQTVEPTAKRSRRKEARPGEILDAAYVEFSTYGFQAARLDRIAKAAGVAKGTIYLYFDSKNDLFRRMIADNLEAMVHQTEDDSRLPDVTTGDLIDRLLDRLYTMMSQDRVQSMMRIFLREGDRMPKLIEVYHAAIVERGTAALQVICDRAIARGDVAADNPTCKAPQIIIAPAMFSMIHRIVFADVHELPMAEFKKAHRHMVLAGLGLA